MKDRENLSIKLQDFPSNSDGKESVCYAGSLGLIPGLVRSLEKIIATHSPVFLPGESQGPGSLVGCRLWGHAELDTTDVTQQQLVFLPGELQGQRSLAGYSLWDHRVRYNSMASFNLSIIKLDIYSAIQYKNRTMKDLHFPSYHAFPFFIQASLKVFFFFLLTLRSLGMSCVYSERGHLLFIMYVKLQIV